MDKQNMKLIAALLGGAAVGATLAVLFAPAKGSELRNTIMKEAGGLTDILDKKIKDVSGIINRISDIYSDVKTK